MSRKKRKPGLPAVKPANRYQQIIGRIFSQRYLAGASSVDFERTELDAAADDLGLPRVKNLGDLTYSFRFRSLLPEAVTATAPKGLEWIIRYTGRSEYRLVLSRVNRIQPRPDAFQVKIPDATPQIVTQHASGDEQAVLTKVRYNRLIDLFLRVTAYHLQSHLRTTVTDMGQIETDDIYVAVRNTGQQFVVPVQAKGGRDQIGIVQVEQDVALCRQRFPDLTPRPVAVQFKKNEPGVIVMFELVIANDELRVIDEKHYRLVPAADITADELRQMATFE